MKETFEMEPTNKDRSIENWISQFEDVARATLKKLASGEIDEERALELLHANMQVGVDMVRGESEALKT